MRCTCHAVLSQACVKAAVGKRSAATCWRKLFEQRCVTIHNQPVSMSNSPNFNFSLLTAIRPVVLGITADDGPLCLYGR